jgi:hypothetical protein
MLVEEWPNDATGLSNDGQNAQYVNSGGTATNVPCNGGFTTTNANDNLEAAFYQPQNVTPTNPSGFSTSVSSTPWFSAYEVVAATSTYNPTYVTGLSSFDNTNVCVAFKQPGGAAVLHTLTTLGAGK